MAKYLLSPNAKKNLKEIKRYSTARFGEQQTRLYLENLRARMHYLADNPKLGKTRDELKPGYLSYFEGSHTIYYKVLGKHIAIIDILHQSMESMQHL